MSMRYRAHIPSFIFLSIVLTLWLFPEPSAAQEIVAKDLGVYQRAGDKYELVTTVTATYNISTQFRIQFDREGNATIADPINFDKKWGLKNGKAEEIRFEVPRFRENIDKLKDAWLVFKGQKGFRHFSNDSGEIKYYPLDVKITALDGDLVFKNEVGTSNYSGDLKVLSDGKANVKFKVFFVGGTEANLDLFADGQEWYKTTTVEDKIILNSTLLGRHLDDFKSLTLKYQVDGRKGWKLVKTASGKLSVYPEVPEETVPEETVPEEFPPKINVHINKVNGKALQGGTVAASLSAGENGILTLKIITEHYEAPFSAKVEYKTDNDVSFRPLGEIEIDSNTVERDVKFRWENTRSIEVKVTSDDLESSDTATVKISALPPGSEQGMMKRLELWAEDYLLYIIIIPLLIVIAFVTRKMWWGRLPGKSSSVKDITLTDDNLEAYRKFPGAVRYTGKKNWVDIKKTEDGYRFTLNKSHLKKNEAAQLSIITFKDSSEKDVDSVTVKYESKKEVGEVASGAENIVAHNLRSKWRDITAGAVKIGGKGGADEAPPADSTSEKDVIGELIKLLSDNIPSVRQKAVAALGNTGKSDNRIAEALLKCLSDNSGVFRRTVVESLGKTGGGDEKKIEALTKRLSDTEPEMIIAAAGALGRMGKADENTVNSLVKLFDNNTPSFRAKAADMLGKICGADANSVESHIDTLVGYLSSDIELLRSSAALALGSIGRSDERIIDSLLPLLSSNSPQVRGGAAQALGAIGGEDERVIPELLRLVSDEDKAVREFVATALGTIVKVDEEVIDEEVEKETPVGKKLPEIDINDTIVLSEENNYQFSFTIQAANKPKVLSPEWLIVSVVDSGKKLSNVKGSNKGKKPKRKDKGWDVTLKSGMDFQELRHGLVKIEAEGYRPKTATVIHSPTRVSAQSQKSDITPPQPSTIRLKLGSAIEDIVPTESISLEIKDLGSEEEIYFTVDDKDNTSKITVHKPLPSTSQDALMDQLRQLLEEKGIDNPGTNRQILEKLTNHALWNEDTPVENTPIEDTSDDDIQVEDTLVEDTPVEDTPVEDTPVEEQVAGSPQDRQKFYEAAMLIWQALGNASHYDGRESDIESLDRIIERTQKRDGTFSSGNQELLRNLMNWGANFYNEREIEQAKKGVWAVFEKAMHELLGILVIYRSGVPFTSRDHLRFEGSDPSDATVARVIRPGFKVSAIAENGQRGLVLEKAHVITGKSG